MKKVSKVAKVDFTGSWEREGKTYYSHQYVFEDGTQLNANHVQMNPFKVGDELEYEVTGNDPKGNPKGKVGKLNQGTSNYSGGGSQKSYVDNSDAILYQTCLKAISENYVSRSGGTIIELKIEEVDRIATLALHLAQLSKKNIETLRAN